MRIFFNARNALANPASAIARKIFVTLNESRSINQKINENRIKIVTISEMSG